MVCILEPQSSAVIRKSIFDALRNEPADSSALAVLCDDVGDGECGNGLSPQLREELESLMADGVVGNRYGLYFLTAFGRMLCEMETVPGSAGRLTHTDRGRNGGRL